MSNLEGKMPGEEKKILTLEGLIAAAKAEDWDSIDSSISQLCNDVRITEWACQAGLLDPDDNIRDLAASILEKSRCDLGEGAQEKLSQMVVDDPNAYAQYRASFALFSRGDRSDRVLNKIRGALDDEAVKEIAEQYLAQLEDIHRNE